MIIVRIYNNNLDHNKLVFLLSYSILFFLIILNIYLYEDKTKQFIIFP